MIEHVTRAPDKLRILSMSDLCLVTLAINIGILIIQTICLKLVNPINNTYNNA